MTAELLVALVAIIYVAGLGVGYFLIGLLHHCDNEECAVGLAVIFWPVVVTLLLTAAPFYLHWRLGRHFRELGKKP